MCIRDSIDGIIAPHRQHQQIRLANGINLLLGQHPLRRVVVRVIMADVDCVHVQIRQPQSGDSAHAIRIQHNTASGQFHLETGMTEPGDYRLTHFIDLPIYCLSLIHI